MLFFLLYPPSDSFPHPISLSHPLTLALSLSLCRSFLHLNPSPFLPPLTTLSCSHSLVLALSILILSLSCPLPLPLAVAGPDLASAQRRKTCATVTDPSRLPLLHVTDPHLKTELIESSQLALCSQLLIIALPAFSASITLYNNANVWKIYTNLFDYFPMTTLIFLALVGGFDDHHISSHFVSGSPYPPSALPLMGEIQPDEINRKSTNAFDYIPMILM